MLLDSVFESLLLVFALADGDVALDVEDPVPWPPPAAEDGEVAVLAGVVADEAGSAVGAAAVFGAPELPVAEFSKVLVPASVPTGASTLGPAGAAAGVDAGAAAGAVELLLELSPPLSDPPVDTICAPTPVVGASST